MGVRSFTVPVNRTGNKLNRLPQGFSTAGEEFDMHAQFYGTDPCDPDDCSLLEYRQEVRGRFTHNGRALPVTLPSGYLHPTNWREDGYFDASYGPHYGHRDEFGGVDDRYLPARADGCEYSGHDYPQIGGNSGDHFEIDLEFRACIIDSESGAPLNSFQHWFVQFVGRLA